jgi:hypothetical protein
METAMQTEAFEAKRTPEGAIDIRHYARSASADRRLARANAARAIGRGSRRAVFAILAFIAFWNIPAMGDTGKDWPYR